MNIKLKHYHELDGVRAIAVIMVMFFHFFQDIEASGPVIKLTLFGKTGVSLFFVLSGFLITRILLNSKEKNSYFKSFYMRRILRIFPLYYFFLLIYYFIFPLVSDWHAASFHEQIWYWTFIQNFAITFNWKSFGPLYYWSLAVEEHFYLFWPFIIYYCPVKKIKWVVLFLCFISFLTRVILIYNHIEESLLTFARFDELALGSFLAIMERENKLISNHSKKFLFAFFALLLPLFYLSFKNGSYSLLDNSLRHLVLGLVYASFVAFIVSVSSDNRLKQLLKTPFFSFTGKISYGLYVYHPTCFLIIHYYLKDSNLIISFILSFGLAYVISALSYHFFEKRFLKLKSKFPN
ncbi:MAG: acyltransferase [Chryseobacterium sp.]|jgi:peptidoglycan/LPS O-acetylase OafA/YrhL|uniref:acyltransferase family protein n=1 Tax=Chryseobacterium sp. TaxID=1871047 RepID=UPI002817DDD6|nr:acyltransferase [Chryseobacterium sp.]MDR2236766.1 acyltransferase [Chryseobacterium sp.]